MYIRGSDSMELAEAVPIDLVLAAWVETVEYYTINDLCWGRHGVLLNSKRHIDRRGAEVNMIKCTVQ